MISSLGGNSEITEVESSIQNILNAFVVSRGRVGHRGTQHVEGLFFYFLLFYLPSISVVSNSGPGELPTCKV